ncbi:MAG: kelch repeat-containing protein [Candidatus Thorarchaeota archaeon]
MIQLIYKTRFETPEETVKILFLYCFLAWFHLKPRQYINVIGQKSSDGRLRRNVGLYTWSFEVSILCLENWSENLVKFRVLIVICIAIAFITQTIPLSSSEYVPAQTSIRPEARGAHSMTFDPYNGVAVIFGGFALSGGWHHLGDTWIYSYTENSWTSLTLSSSPSTRSNHAMVYCNETNEIILYGGQGSGA